MKIFVYSTHIMYTPHIETDLELIQLHLDKGDTVYRFICNGHLSVCDLNRNHEFLTCLKCRDIRNKGEDLLKGKVINIPIHLGKTVLVPEHLYACKTSEDLKKIYFENFDVGYAITSTMISMLRNPEFDVQSNLELILKYYKSSVELYLSTIEYIKRYTPDMVYLYNGRYSQVRAVLRACEITRTKFITHERAGAEAYYDLFFNKLPHDKKYIISRTEERWLNSDHRLEEKKRIGSEFFIHRKNGNPKDWVSYTKEQDSGLLPEGYNKAKKNIAIYNSSTDEYASISEDWAYSFFLDQEEFIDHLMTLFKDHKDYHFYLRVHPNLKGISNSQTDRISALKHDNLTLIPADSKVSSYYLLENCDKVITFGSTMGIEAVYWGKPSIIVADGFYGTDSLYKADSYEMVFEFVKNELSKGDELEALKFGYYHSVKGIKFKYFKPNGLFKGTFKNVNLMEVKSKLRTFILKVKNTPVVSVPLTSYMKMYKKYKLKMLVR